MEAPLPYPVHVCIYVLFTQLSLPLCDPMVSSPPGSSVHGILQARILEWVAIPSFRRSSLPRDPTWVSHMAGMFFIIGATREALTPRIALCISFMVCA